MASRFLNEYEGQTYSNAEKSKFKDDICKGLIKFIEKDGKVIGFVSFDICHYAEKTCEHYYRTINIMWIDPQHRHQGIATSVRKKLFTEGGKCPIIGTTISAERAMSNPEYWSEQGLKVKTIAPHNRNRYGRYATNEDLKQDPNPEKILISWLTTQQCLECAA